MNPPIFVTGSQRSGTTIAAIILAADHNKQFIDELEFIAGKDYTNCIIHYPNALDGFIHLHHFYPDAEFVVVTRPKKDIINSMRRIRWCKDDVKDWDQFLEDYVKQRLIRIQELFQYLPDQTVELAYETLQYHRLFVKDRANFTSKQWKKGVPRGPKYWDSNVKCIEQCYVN